MDDKKKQHLEWMLDNFPEECHKLTYHKEEVFEEQFKNKVR